jgi:endonuclease YncB( thermonuclease family)
MNNTYHQDQIEEFKKIDPSSIKNHIFQDLELEAYCYNIHDTDTISILFKYNYEIIKYNIRIAGIDAPELHSKILYEKELCIKGTEYLKNLILNKIIKVKIKKIDKYGRLLADLYTLDLYPNNIYINKDLIDKGYCREYNGEAKTDWNLDNPVINTVKTTDNTLENTTDNTLENTTDNTRVKRKYVKKNKLNIIN